jgi:hypothetical protein
MAFLLDFSLAFGFNVSPEIVILSWLGSSDLSDKILKSSPKINFFQNWIHPPINNAISSIKLPRVMPVMFLMS